MNRKTPVLIAIVAIALIIGFTAQLKTCTSSYYSYGIESKPAVSDNGKYVATVMAKTNTTSYSENGGYRKSSYSTEYYLNLYETSTGKLIKQEKIISTKELKNGVLLNYGGFNNKLWLFTNELKAYDTNTLQEVTGEKKLNDLNKFLREHFMDAPGSVTGNASEGYIDFADTNREQYRVELANLSITPVKDLQSARKPAYEESIAAVFNREETFGKNCDTLKGRIYFLAKDSADLESFSPDHKTMNEGHKTVGLYSSAFSVKNYNGHNLYSYSNIKKLSETRYLNGNFLNDHSNAVIQLEDPAGYIIVHQDSFTNNAKTILTRIDLNHNKIWQVKTNISTKLTSCVVKNNYCIITGRISYNISQPAGSDGFCIIDLKTGKIIKPSIH